MRPFGHRSGTLRGIAAFVSLALTAAIFLLLRVTSVPRPEAKRTEREVAVVLFPSPPVRTRDEPSPVAAPAAKAATRITAGPRPRGAISPVRAEPEPAFASSGPASSAPAEALAASAPLRLDAETLRRAIAGSAGPIQQMARRGGAELDSPRATRSQALADMIAEKGVADCLAPNAGGSLLSAPLLLLLAVQGKCK